MKDKFITLRVDEEEKKQMRRDAAKVDRSTSNYLIWLWKEKRDS